MTTLAAPHAAPAALLLTLRRQGFTIRVEGDRLWVTPRERLTPTEVEQIRDLRDGLFDLVAAEQEASWQDKEAIAVGDDVVAKFRLHRWSDDDTLRQRQWAAMDAFDAAWLARDLGALKAAAGELKRLWEDPP